MNLSWFRVPKDIVFGQGTLEYLKDLTGSRATIVTGGSSMRKLGYLEKTRKHLENGGMQVSIVDGVEPNPSVQTVRRGAQEMLEFQPDVIVALGGGSALDAAKIMWVFYEYPELTFEQIIPVGSIPHCARRPGSWPSRQQAGPPARSPPFQSSPTRRRRSSIP